MPRFEMTMAYDGHLFHGFQRQLNQRTVQGTIEETLKKMAEGQRIVVHGSGRTDAGVHALGQVTHFDFPNSNIPASRMVLALNSMMPADIIFKDAGIVNEDFHAQYSTHGKWYRYIVNQDCFVDPFKRFYTGHYPYKLNVSKMQEAALDLLEEHDFTSFAASGGQIINKVRTIYYVKIWQKSEENEIIFDFIGNGFLYNMVRIMVGALLEIGDERHPVHDLKHVVPAKGRQEVRNTAPASGLYLYHVFYEEVPEKYRSDKKNN